MSNIQVFQYLFGSRDFYEPMDCYEPDAGGLLEVARRFLPEGWSMERNGIWSHCSEPSIAPPRQGWKIHISATVTNAAAILATVIPVLTARKTAFKFALDKTIVYLQNSKRWPRSGAGKFITIYPADTPAFLSLIEELHNVLVGFRGPYILSDKRYKDSRVLYYRYGGIMRTDALNSRGERVLTIQAPDGTAIRDRRMPYSVSHEWAPDPVGGAAGDSAGEDTLKSGENTLKNGRYVVNSALAFSSSGGVYLATDTQTGREVVIKEARPLSNVYPNGADGVDLLKKEHRLLTRLADTGIAAQPLDFFSDWEHCYLVEEFIDGALLRFYNSAHSLALRTAPTAADAQEFVDRFCRVFSRIARNLEILHSRGIVFTDISHYNLIVINDGEDVKFIDFEAAHEIGIDPPTPLFTPGFASADLASSYSEREDDYFGLGALMLAALMPINGMMALDTGACGRFLEALSRDLGLPASIPRCIQGLMAVQRADRITPARVIEILESDSHASAPPAHQAPVYGELRKMAESAMEYVAGTASYDRVDRLFPADPALYATNPLSLAHGACGVAYCMKQITGTVSPAIMDWICGKQITAEAFPPGLYAGTSGIGWTLLEIGREERGLELLRAGADHPLRFDSPDLYNGAAGWGLAQLKAFVHTQDEFHLAKAAEAGDYLIRSKHEEDVGFSWPWDDDTAYGLAHGASGVALFLLYLYGLTGQERYLEVGKGGMDFDIGNGVETADGGLTWKISQASRTRVPYWRWGGAGVGTALLRYQKVLADDEYASVLRRIAVDCDRKYTIYPGRFFGLAGLGDFLLDMESFDKANGAAYREKAEKVASGIALFGIQRPTGIAFPGHELVRISCDFGTGASGIALFLHRLVAGTSAPFLLDAALDGIPRDRRGAPDRRTIRAGELGTLARSAG